MRQLELNPSSRTTRTFQARQSLEGLRSDKYERSAVGCAERYRPCGRTGNVIKSTRRPATCYYGFIIRLTRTGLSRACVTRLFNLSATC